MSGTREENFFFAMLSEQAGRWDDMTRYMTAIASMGKPLDVHERHALSAAFKNSVAARRNQYRLVGNLEKDPSLAHVVCGYRQQIRQELEEKCENVLDVISSKVLAYHDMSDIEASVFYTKMQGDYYRYKAEFSSDAQKEAAVDAAKASYSEAKELASGLPKTNSVRLGLALNISVFYYEVLGWAEEARALAQKTLDEAKEELPTISEEQQGEANSIMLLLRDNLEQWSGGQDGTEVQDF